MELLHVEYEFEDGSTDTFEHRFIAQDEFEDRSIDQTLDLAWDLLSVFPEGEMKRRDPKTLEAARARHVYRYAAAARSSSS
jgi:V/A-type H+-transporting ATPase subunit B